MSLIATAVQHMLAAGMDAAAIVRAVADMEAVAQPTRSTGATRQARYEERKRQKASESVRTDGPDALVSPAPLPSSEPKGSSEIKTTTRVKASKRVPESWSPSEADLAVGAEEGFSPGEIARELAKIRDYEFPKPHSDWSATFRSWLRRGAERRPNPQANRHERPHQTPRDDRMARAYAGAMDLLDECSGLDGGSGGGDQGGSSGGGGYSPGVARLGGPLRAVR